MKDNAIKWIILLTILVALGIASLGLYVYMDELISGYFVS